LFYSLANADGGRPIYTMSLPEELGAVSRDRSISTLSDRFHDPWDQRLSREQMFVQHLRQQFPMREVRDVTPIVDQLRWIKDEDEIRALRQCARIGVEGINEAIRATRPGVVEHELADVAHYVWMRRGARGDAYFPIVASATNSNYTHYNANSRTIGAGDLIVMDFAPEFQYEDTDITRTWPSSGAFNAEQTNFYNVVLEAHRAIIEAIKPGVTPKELKDLARGIYEKHGMGRYWPGGIGHFVGMSTHDPGPYDKPFVAGVVFNVEPMIDVKEKGWHFRLEDTVVVTPNGHEVLTAGSPWELADVYKLRDSGSSLDLKPNHAASGGGR
jgi:Xaa-Pro aminopeptidase